MSSAIQNILQRTLGDIARATKYDVKFSFSNPTAGISSEELVIMGKTASFPGKAHTTVDFKYKGRTIPIKGQTKYTQTWECTFVLTEDHRLKNAIELWIEALDQKHNYSSKVKGLSTTQHKHNTNGYTTTIFIAQRDFDDVTNTAEYELYNAFPTEVSAVQTNYESRGQLQEITVTFAYSHYVMKNTRAASGSFIDDLVASVEDVVIGKTQTAKKATGAWVNKQLSYSEENETKMVSSMGKTK